MWFNRYNSLNFKVQFFKWTCVCFRLLSNNESNFAKLFRQHFKRFTNECQMLCRYLNWVFKVSTSCSNTQSKSLSKWHGCLVSELLWLIIPFHIDSKAVFSSAMLVGFGMCSIPVSQPHDNPVDWLELYKLMGKVSKNNKKTQELSRTFQRTSWSCECLTSSSAERRHWSMVLQRGTAAGVVDTAEPCTVEPSHPSASHPPPHRHPSLCVNTHLPAHTYC